MVRNRLITVLTLNNGVLFRTRNFAPDYRYTLNFADAWSVDEVVILDITREGEGDREHFYEIVKSFARSCFVPLTVGGGVRTIEEVTLLLGIGADKVAVNTMALDYPEFLTEASRLYGSQCIVASLDAGRTDSGDYRVFRKHGREQTEWTPEAWAMRAAEYGAGEILVQSIDNDGMLEGYDLELCRRVSDAVSIPVLICSGAGRWEHFVEGVRDGRAQAVCTTNIYHFTESSIKSAKAYLQKAGVSVRV